MSKAPKMFTEGNEFQDHDFYKGDTIENDSQNMIKDHLDSEFEPVGS